MDDRPAPVVTITDPRRPTEVGDVLIAGDEKAPWRAKRWHYEALALIALLALAVVIPQSLVASRAADHRKAIAAAEAARVSVSLEPTADPSTTITAAVTNDGPDPITVLSLHLGAAGYRTLTVDSTAAAHAVTRVTIPDTRTCTEDLLNGSLFAPATVQLRVAGRTVTRSVIAGQELWQALIDVAQDRCGFLPGSKALGATLAAVRPVTKGLDVTLTLTNNGRLPLVVSSAYSNTPGLEVLQGPARDEVPKAPATSTFRFRVTVTDCTQLSADVTGGLADVQLNTNTTLSNGSSTGDGVQLTERFPAFAEAIRRLTEQQCGAT